MLSAADLTHAEKHAVLQSQLSSGKAVSHKHAVSLSRAHGLKATRGSGKAQTYARLTVAALVSNLLAHTCTRSCVVTMDEARAAGIACANPLKRSSKDLTGYADLKAFQHASVLAHILSGQCLSLSALKGLSQNHNLRLSGGRGVGQRPTCFSRTVLQCNLGSHICDANCKTPAQDAYKAGLVGFKMVGESAPKRVKRSKRSSSDTRAEVGDNPAGGGDGNAWLDVLSSDVVRQIEREWIQATGIETLSTRECSFCGINEQRIHCKMIAREKLDISLLEKMVSVLRRYYGQPKVFSYRAESLIDGSYVLCRECAKCVKVRECRFFKAPITSYANGTWRGPLPLELQGLSWLEEQCIARARVTRCTFKLNSSPTAQRFARGNVCVLPQDPTLLATILPPPLDVFHDEIAFILVASQDSAVTIADLGKSPLLVRRGRVIAALEWLKANNPVYREVTIDGDAAARLPEDGTPCLPATVVVSQTAAAADGAGYVNCDSVPDTSGAGDDQPIITGCTLSDVNGVDTPYSVRKLRALNMLRTGEAKFVKLPAQSTPMSMSHNPKAWACAFPTIFPWGCGMFQDLIRLDRSGGFRRLDLPTHARHIFKLGDKMPQKHMTFPFVVANKMQITHSCFQASIAVNRQWFPKVQQALRGIDPSQTEAFAKRLQFDKRAVPQSDGERAILEAISYVHYLQTDLVGSNAQTLRARERLRALYRHVGLPSIFLTLNFADAHNPIAQFLAGMDIDLDTAFDLLPGSNARTEGSKRAKTVADNPFASAEFFYFMLNSFLDIVLGRKRPSGIGILGTVTHYFIVVENQGRGSLHAHMLLWISGALSPSALRTRIAADMDYRHRVFRWLESIIKHSYPMGTVHRDPSADQPKSFAPMSRPMHPDSTGFHEARSQSIRDLLHQCGQVHDTHSDTCFKHLPAPMRRFAKPEDCRFGAPWQLFETTCLGEDGQINLQRLDPCVNAYNDTITYLCRCNMDIKAMFTSGSNSLRILYYVTNYVSKVTMDTSMFVSILHAVLKVIGPDALQSEDGARKFLLKMSNQFIAKRELSGPQVAAMLIKQPNFISSCQFEDVYWSAIPRFALPQYYPPIGRNIASSPRCAYDIPTRSSAVISEEEAVFADIAQSSDTLFLCSGKQGSNEIFASESKLVMDVLYRPHELEAVCLYDQLSKWKKVKQRDDRDRCMNDTGVSIQTAPEPTSASRRRQRNIFQSAHPQTLSHCLVRRETAVIPTLIGVPLPRRPRDIGDQNGDVAIWEKYMATMLLLFKPWSRSHTALLKPPSQTWSEAWRCFEHSTAGVEAQSVMEHQQQIFDCEDAKDQYIKQRGTRLNEIRKELPPDSLLDNSRGGDMEWQLAIAEFEEDAVMQAPEDALFEVEHHPQSFVGLRIADQARVFATNRPDQEYNGEHPICMRDHEAEQAKSIAKAAQQAIATAKGVIEQEIVNAVSQNDCCDHRDIRDTTNRLTYPIVTTVDDDAARLRSKYCDSHDQRSLANPLLPWQQTCLEVIDHRTLNDRQALAFLIVCEHEMNGKDRPELKLVVHGPGGAGKSALLDAIKDFYVWLGCATQVKCVAPSGVAAINIHGSTIHHEASIPVSGGARKMIPSPKAAAGLQKRWKHARLVWIDEIYFVGAELYNAFDHNLRVGRQTASQPLGGLSSVTVGDLYQLEPPAQVSLFDGAFVQAVRGNGNKSIAVSNGIASFRERDQCVILTQVMRQREPAFIDLINRVRVGDDSHRAADFHMLEERVIGTHAASNGDSITLTPPPFSLWATNPAMAAPLITFTNIMRDHWNLRGAKAFADATGQQLHRYYSRDYMKHKGGTGSRLPIAIQHAAWRADVKKASDYSGALPLCIGMPVFLIENIAVELGLANNAPGYVQGIEYEEDHDRRFAISVDVEFPSFRDHANPENHRVKLAPMHGDIRFKLNQDSAEFHKARRMQIPLILAFAFTVHNSQSRSLNSAILDISSSKSQAMTYVMLSRVRYWDKLFVLRPFSINQLFSKASEQKRHEDRRLHALAQETEQAARDRLRWYYSFAR